MFTIKMAIQESISILPTS